jgi:lipopolysaccharide biosynthesis protein
MSNFIIEIEQETNLLEIETSYSESFNNIEVERYETFNIDIINTEKLLASDLPDDIPMSKIVGNLHVSRIDNLDDYLSEIDVDGGSP